MQTINPRSKAELLLFLNIPKLYRNINPIVAAAAPEYAKSNPQNSDIESNKVKNIDNASPIKVYWKI
jgi:hypothetical protein